MEHVDIKVIGLVQGVFFRKNTEQKAKELSIKGFVENCDDESVHIEAEGDIAQLTALIEWCHKGPEKAEVDKVLVTKGVIKGYTDFKIHRK